MTVVYCCDVGSVANDNFAWVRILPGQNPQGSRCIEQLRRLIGEDLAKGKSVALGVEAPLFVPVPDDHLSLGKAREGEGRYSFSTSIGAAAMTTGIVQIAWILQGLFKSKPDSCQFTTDWTEWKKQGTGQQLFCWEAFVSGDAHSNEHVRDAATAAMYFMDHQNELGKVNAIKGNSTLSLVHAAALWSGWSKNIAGLHNSALVIKPSKPFEGNIDKIDSAMTIEVDALPDNDKEAACTPKRKMRCVDTGGVHKHQAGGWLIPNRDYVCRTSAGERFVLTWSKKANFWRCKPTVHKLLQMHNLFPQGGLSGKNFVDIDIIVDREFPSDG